MHGGVRGALAVICPSAAYSIRSVEDFVKLYMYAILERDFIRVMKEIQEDLGRNSIL